MNKYNGKYWVSELSGDARIELVNFYKQLLKNDYSKEEVNYYVNDLMNEKLCNIEDTVGIDYLIKLSKM